MRRSLSIIIVLIFLFGCEKWELPEYLLSDSLGNDNIPSMVTIPGGSFQMGSNNGNSDEKPVHTVKISSFMMSKTEVTVKQFREFINETSYKTDAEAIGGSKFYNGVTQVWELHSGVSWKNDATGNSPANESHPVLHVSYNDAKEFCLWLTNKEGKQYRLPTEAEWEYAAGGGSSHYMYSWGNNLPTQPISNVGDETFAKALSVTNSSDNIFINYYDGFVFTAPVASFSPNSFGLYDMSGNVKEWCNDWYNSSYYSVNSLVNPTGPATGTSRVWRGGYWYAQPWASSNYHRWGATPSFGGHLCGIRVVAEI